MPNDCYNIIQNISHDNPEIIKRLVDVLSQKTPSFFSEFLPCPPHETLVSYWGTKWDVYDVDITEINENTLKISFYTAWTPPINAYSQLEKIGFTIDAMFMESGFDFCGYWLGGKMLPTTNLNGDKVTGGLWSEGQSPSTTKSEGQKIMFENVKDRLDEIPEDFHFYFQDNNEDDEEEEM